MSAALVPNGQFSMFYGTSTNPRDRGYCYQPCKNGLHVCGFHNDGENFQTIANVRTLTAADAEALFEEAKAELQTLPGEPYDFVIDLQMDGDCDRDFTMNRQMLARLEALANRERCLPPYAAPTQTPEKQA